MQRIKQLSESWRLALFGTDSLNHGWLRRTAVFGGRLLYRIALKFKDKELHTQATSLAYTTLLSLVPFLAVTFSVLKGLGVHNQLEPMLLQSLEPLGEQGAEIGERILTYVNNLNFAVVGFMGIALLFWTVISLLQKVEEAFNAIWRVSSVRSLGRRVSDYLSVTLVGPVFMISALGLTTVVLDNETVQRLASIEPLGWILLSIGQWMPYLLFCAAFAFLYAFLTNTRIGLIPALAGGVFTSLAWYGVGTLFATFVASSSNYSAIYTGLAAAILFIIWLNVAWLIILVGAHVTRYWQHPHLLSWENQAAALEDGRREAVALELMTLIGRSYLFDEPRWTQEALAARECGGSPEQLEDLLHVLKDRRLIVATDEDPRTYLPARAIKEIYLRDIVDAAGASEAANARLPAVQTVIDQINRAISDRLQGQTLDDLVLADDTGSAHIALHPGAAE